MKTMRIEAVAMALLLAGGLLAADAAICTWSNAGGTGLWSTPANWSGGVVPEPGDDVVFDGAVSQAACSANVVTNNLASLKLLNGYAGTVAFAVKAVEGAQQLNLSGALEAHSGNLVFAGDTTAIGDGTSTVKFGQGYTIQAASVLVAAGASLNADGMGFPKATGPGAGANGSANGNGDNRGAGYGGEGAYRVISTGRGMPYGSATAPTALGSGGGHSSSGPGGGALKLVVSGAISIDGRLSANGGNGTLNWGCGGSGGSIWIASGTLQGVGVIAANSGYSAATWRGSGGGRIDLSGAVNNFAGRIQVLGGEPRPPFASYRRGMAGSIVLPQSAGTGWTRDRLVVTNELRLGNSQTFGAIVVTNGGALWLDANENLDTFTFTTLDVHNAGQVVFPGNRERINVESGGTATAPHGGGATITGATVTVHSGGRLHADGQGFPRMNGPGKGAGNNYTGGGYGGLGGGSDGVTGGLTYGAALAPTAIGSGGGHADFSGAGGGAFKLIATAGLTVHGSLTADGGNATAEYGGGGSGGSIWLEVGSLGGSGTLSAKGGNYHSKTSSCGGGGGRMLIRHAGSAGYTFNGTASVDGGYAPTDPKKGAPGSLFIQDTLAVNVAPNAPVAAYPDPGATLHAPYLRLSATDGEADFMRFKVEIATDAAFNDIVRTIDQTASQDLWRGQTEQTYTAYLDDQVATVVIAPPLTPGATYHWRAYAIDPDGANQWSDPSAARSFTTFATAANWWVCDPNAIFGDRKWETAANWSRRSVPQPGEAVRFDGGYFDLDCTAAIVSNHLASLTLSTNYTKTATFAAKAVEGGMALSLSGDLGIEGGAMVLKGDTAAVGSGTPMVKHGMGYRIEAANVVVSGSGALHADGCGFPYSQGPGEGSGPDNGRGAGYGGRGGDGSNPALWYAGIVYGTNLMPSALGSGGGHDYVSDPLSGSGGGALWIVAAGDVTIDGRLSSDGAPSRGTWASGASGGSLLVSAGKIQGVGQIAARGGSVPAGATAGGGGGGRLCLVFGDTPETRLGILGGDRVRARIVDELPMFGGAVSVAGGTGYYNDETQGAQPGTIAFIRALAPPGTIILVR